MKILIQSNKKQKLASKIAAASFIKQGFTHHNIKFLEFENKQLQSIISQSNLVDLNGRS